MKASQIKKLFDEYTTASEVKSSYINKTDAKKIINGLKASVRREAIVSADEVLNKTKQED